MKTEVLHPDHLQPGHRVGPWHIVQVLGRGGSSLVFKVERDGRLYSLKMALRPLSNSREELPEEEYVEEKSVYRQLAREAAALFTYSSHPNLLRVYAVDFWPNPTKGYPFLVTDFIDGDNWHQWRWRKPPDAAGLVDTFSDVVRTVGVLHQRGVYHRDLKADNLLIRREDGRPFLIDFGTVRLPGALTKTLGLPEGVLHLLPPELLAYTRTEAWKRGEPFQGGVAADLYALGVLLYQALTDLHPFNPELPDKELLAAIATVPPTAPHLLNLLAPRSLSDIAMKLLEKQPEGRYPSTEALLQALGTAAERERQSPSWKVPLFPAGGSPAVESSPQEMVAPPAQSPETAREAPEEAQPSKEEAHQAEAQQSPPAAPGRSRRARWPLVLLASLAVLGLALWLTRSTLLPPPEAQLPGSGRFEKGSPPVSTPPRSTPSSVLAVWLCAVAGIGCPAAQVKPPEPEDCPKEATEAMFQELKVRTASPLRAIVDINQPGDFSETGVYQDGPIIGRITEGDGNLPEGTLLHGRLWTGPGLYWSADKRPAVMARYTLAVLPDGRKYPVCIVLGDPDDGRAPKVKGSKPGASVLARELPVSPVWRWP
ncbi:serine/threonine-protein kinase [Vitiosangium sp. GDMCC 1.1324]|uniref:serine/threonine protein kinase n=1 Tax=Vitiosangium sp. (strain GDMCC 1.1324) TaxID=2138576 RepID=UPI000D398D46|nr:serine/threonine-protein kinase [Vitiosangium sp. GDMCC 1.1324]PTL79562.1 serine/threonine protein kinase [Vitiosangium sp. GDMCC 1.1324]